MMPFGKYKGVSLADIPEKYLQWCADYFTDVPQELLDNIKDELFRRMAGRLIENCSKATPPIRKLLGEYISQVEKTGYKHELLTKLKAISRK